MIKVLFYIDTTLARGGAEKVLRELVNNLDAKTYQITVHTLWKEDARPYLLPHIRYRYIFPRKNKAYQALYRIQTALGLTYALHLKDDYDIEIAYLENGPTKVIAHSTNKTALKIAWVHCDLSKMAADLDRYVLKTAPWYRKFDKIICVSEYIQTVFRQLYGSGFAMQVLHNTLDESVILQKSREPLPDTIFKARSTVVTVGRLYPAKGYDRLLTAHKMLLMDGIEHDLWILGEGPEHDSLQAYVDQNHLNSSVHFLGFQSNPYPFMRCADIVVCSSYYEGYSTMVTEALILGKPVVTTPCSGMDELLGDSETGLITEDSVEGIFLGMKTMLSDPELCRQYADKAKLRGQHFSKDTTVSQTQHFFITELAKKQQS